MGSAAMGTEGMVTDVLDESASSNGQGFASSAQGDYLKDQSSH
ncbi:hypothetical protein [Pedobacter sp. BMA]|nr:hypothetical protein [Pedobacter sp. BMA]